MILGKCKYLAGISAILASVVIAAGYCGCGGDKSGNASGGNRITGEICRIQLKKNCTISPEKINNVGTIFTDFERTADGTVYLLDGRAVRIYMFDTAGVLRKEFLASGSGPGEYQPHPKLQILDNHLWILGLRKIGKYSLDGELIEEFKLEKIFRSIRVIDSHSFIATHEEFSERGGKPYNFKKIAGLFDLRTEALKQTLIEEEDIGRLMLPMPEKRVLSVLPGARVLPDVIFAYNFNSGVAYFANTAHYCIYARRLLEEKTAAMTIRYNPIRFSDEDKDYVTGKIKNISDEIKKQIYHMLPATMPAIHEMRVLDSGYLLVRRVTGARDSVIDILNPNGEYHCCATFIPGLSPRQLKIYGGVIAVIEETEDNNLYHEYDIQNDERLFRAPVK